MVTFTAADIPNLPKGQRAFRLDSGELFIVQIARIDPRPEDAQVNMKIEAFRANDDGSIMEVDGIAQRIPAHVHSLNMAGLADGQITIENEMADATVKAAERLRNHIAALKAWAKIPVATDSAPAVTTSTAPTQPAPPQPAVPQRTSPQ